VVKDISGWKQRYNQEATEEAKGEQPKSYQNKREK
jgi:hypothetical protein